MKRNDLYRKDDSVLRVIHVQENQVMVIDCVKCTMPFWMNLADMCSYVEYAEEKYYSDVNFTVVDDACIYTKDKAIMHERYAMVTAILPFVTDEKMRSIAIAKVAEQYEVSKQSVRSYLCRYLAFNHIQSLLPQKKSVDRELTKDEKNIRWSLNKFFYNKNRNSLKTAYTMMLKEKYCDAEGNLIEEYPSFYQYRYFYRKHRKLQNYYISREGLSAYQRDFRPLVGGNIQTFAPCPGVGMIDGTVCDIYLVDDAGRLVGRPLLVTCVDAYSGMCLGYSLTWEGGVYALRNLMLNVVTDKVEHCKKHGISITPDEWCNNQLPYKLVSDQGSEYICDTFSQLVELGVQITNLPPYRPELKSWAELLFRLLQDNYKKHLRNRGVIEPDYQERGSHDYRKDACLTMEQFEKIVIHCILYHNSKRSNDNFPYTEEMLEAEVLPYSTEIWKWGLEHSGVRLLDATPEQIILTLLPRTVGRFTRQGLKVNGLRYYNDGYVEMYLCGGETEVAYNPDDVSAVWIIENGRYIRFELIESRFDGRSFDAVEKLKQKQRQISKDAKEYSLQAEIQLARNIEMVANMAQTTGKVSTKGIRDNRQKEQKKQHIDYVRKVGAEDGLE